MNKVHPRRRRATMRRLAMLFNTIGSAGALTLLAFSLITLISLLTWFQADATQTFSNILNIALSVLFHPVGGADIPL